MANKITTSAPVGVEKPTTREHHGGELCDATGTPQWTHNCECPYHAALAQQPGGAAEIEALRAEVRDLRAALSEAHRDGAEADDDVRVALEMAEDHKVRAELLAEALRKIEGFTLSQFAGPHDMAAACVDTAHRALLREQEEGR